MSKWNHREALSPTLVLKGDSAPEGMTLERRLLEEVPLQDEQAALLTRCLLQASRPEDGSDLCHHFAGVPCSCPARPRAGAAVGELEGTSSVTNQLCGPGKQLSRSGPPGLTGDAPFRARWWSHGKSLGPPQQVRAPGARQRQTRAVLQKDTHSSPASGAGGRDLTGKQGGTFGNAVPASARVGTGKPGLVLWRYLDACPCLPACPDGSPLSGGMEAHAPGLPPELLVHRQG